ncbi:transcription elongation factor GreA [Thermostilla marina]
MSNEPIPMTREGYKKLKAELDHLQNEVMWEVEKRIAAAREEGDLRENAEYHGARETQGMIQAKINLLRDKLSRAVIVDPSDLPSDEVAFGCTVKVKDLEFDEIEEYTLVGAGEDDAANGRILITSPLAQGLVGKKVGDIAEIEVPMGTLKLEILEIRRDT